MVYPLFSTTQARPKCEGLTPYQGKKGCFGEYICVLESINILLFSTRLVRRVKDWLRTKARRGVSENTSARNVNVNGCPETAGPTWDRSVLNATSMSTLTNRSVIRDFRNRCDMLETSNCSTKRPQFIFQIFVPRRNEVAEGGFFFSWAWYDPHLTYFGWPSKVKQKIFCSVEEFGVSKTSQLFGNVYCQKLLHVHHS